MFKVETTQVRDGSYEIVRGRLFFPVAQNFNNLFQRYKQKLWAFSMPYRLFGFMDFATFILKEITWNLRI